MSWFLMFPVLFVTRCLSANNDECLRSSKYENVGKGEMNCNSLRSFYSFHFLMYSDDRASSF